MGPGLEGSWAQRLVSPGSWNAFASGHMDVLSKPGSIPSSNFGDFYGGFIEEANLWLNLRSLASSQRKRGRAQSSKLLTVAWSFCDQPPSCSPPEALQELPHYDKISCHPGNSEGFRSSVLGTGVEVQIREGKVLLVASSSKRLQGFQEFCVRNRVQRPVI